MQAFSESNKRKPNMSVTVLMAVYLACDLDPVFSCTDLTIKPNKKATE